MEKNIVIFKKLQHFMHTFKNNNKKQCAEFDGRQFYEYKPDEKAKYIYLEVIKVHECINLYKQNHLCHFPIIWYSN